MSARIDLRREAGNLLEKYPEGRGRSALLPLLHRAQARDGYVTQAAMDEIGEILGLTSAEVLSVASFYTMYHLAPKGRHVISVCHNLACSILGAEKIIGRLEEHLGVDAGKTTSDLAITLERVECLAACDLAPMLQIDYDEMVGPVTPDSAVALLDRALASPLSDAVQQRSDQRTQPVPAHEMTIEDMFSSGDEFHEGDGQ